MRRLDAAVVEIFQDDDGGYRTWLYANMGGYVVNAQRGSLGEPILHRATCETITSTPDQDTRLHQGLIIGSVRVGGVDSRARPAADRVRVLRPVTGNLVGFGLRLPRTNLPEIHPPHHVEHFDPRALRLDLWVRAPESGSIRGGAFSGPPRLTAGGSRLQAL